MEACPTKSFGRGSLDGVYPELAEGLGMTADGQIAALPKGRSQ